MDHQYHNFVRIHYPEFNDFFDFIDNDDNFYGSYEPEFEKTIVFPSCFLENSEHFLNLAKISIKFGKFLNFLKLSRIV